MQKVVAHFQEQRPGVTISVLVDKPLAQLAKVESLSNAAGVAITLGEVEMNSLVAVGAVRREDVKPFARNTYQIVAVAPAVSAGRQPGSLNELASSKMKRIFIEDPARSSLGDRATRGLQRAGLWRAVSAKVVRPEPNAMILAELLAGKADAAMIFKGCLFAEKGSGATMPKTIRIVGELPSDSYPPITYQAAPLAKAPNSELARGFIEFLTSAAGRTALKEAGLTPPTEAGP
jgi:molybdate transport system substrate-binding protein